MKPPLPAVSLPARVLIVDDEPHDRTLLEVMLGPEGFVLQTAASGEEALAMVARQPPDLILLDLMMPGMDGYQVSAAIKANIATRNIPIIMVTALDDRRARMLGLNAGAEDFLTKPVDRAELCVRVRNLLRLKAYGDSFDQYSAMLEGEVLSRTADLRFERDRAQRYLDSAETILLALDCDGRVTLANRYACSVLGWTEDELLGRDWAETCLPARQADAMKATFHEVLAGDVSIIENTIVTKLGAERLIEWRNTVLREDGRVIGTLSSGRDITERTRDADALRAAEERMRFALQGANVGIWDMDCASGVIRWSAILEAQYGLEPGAFQGTMESLSEHIHPDDRASFTDAVELAMITGADFATQYRVIWPDGRVRWLSGAGRFQLDEQGVAVRGIGISQDITERRLLEAQFQQAQKMEAIGELASGVAHDFNNLLTVILGCAELVVSDAGMVNGHREDMAEIIKAAKRAAGLTKQLLAFSRQQVLLAAPLDVNGLIRDMAGMLSRLIGEHINIVLALAPDLALAFADRGQVEQVVMNLVVNARDAMPGGGTVTIETAEVDLDNSSYRQEAVMQGQYVMVAITDTGTGMTRETQRRMFEPFFTTKETGKGTGLGLSTTYGIVKQSKGYIWVYSELGYGTTFKVYLPQTVNEPAPAAAVAPGGKNGSKTVLLVEDEGGIRRLARRILDSAGFRVLEAASADDAVRVFSHNAETIDLLVTDVIMPGFGGPELFSRLHQLAPDLRVVYMSGYTEESAARKAGIDRGQPFVQKPFTAAELVLQVRRALSH
ncbi:MAG: response regulator [Gemmatimonadota bacterium]